MNAQDLSFCTISRSGILLGFFIFTLVLFSQAKCYADSLIVSITDPSQSATVGQTDIFDGTVTNDTGSDLDSTDLFFSFFGYDPNLTVNQLLGSTDFLIPNGETTSVVDLFSVGVGAGAATGDLPVQFALQDINGDLSALDGVTVVNAPTTTTPEPTSLLLLGIGLVPFVWRMRRQMLTVEFGQHTTGRIPK
jgi:hypothetical protein